MSQARQPSVGRPGVEANGGQAPAGGGAPVAPVAEGAPFSLWELCTWANVKYLAVSFLPVLFQAVLFEWLTRLFLAGLFLAVLFRVGTALLLLAVLLPAKPFLARPFLRAVLFLALTLGWCWCSVCAYENELKPPPTWNVEKRNPNVDKWRGLLGWANYFGAWNQGEEQTCFAYAVADAVMTACRAANLPLPNHKALLNMIKDKWSPNRDEGGWIIQVLTWLNSDEARAKGVLPKALGPLNWRKLSLLAHSRGDVREAVDEGHAVIGCWAMDTAIARKFIDLATHYVPARANESSGVKTGDSRHVIRQEDLDPDWAGTCGLPWNWGRDFQIMGHAMLVVGYGEEKGSEQTSYYLGFRNSWGWEAGDWGEVRVHYDALMQWFEPGLVFGTWFSQGFIEVTVEHLLPAAPLRPGYSVTADARVLRLQEGLIVLKYMDEPGFWDRGVIGRQTQTALTAVAKQLEGPTSEELAGVYTERIRKELVRLLRPDNGLCLSCKFMNGGDARARFRR